MIFMGIWASLNEGRKHPPEVLGPADNIAGTCRTLLSHYVSRDRRNKLPLRNPPPEEDPILHFKGSAMEKVSQNCWGSLGGIVHMVHEIVAPIGLSWSTRVTWLTDPQIPAIPVGAQKTYRMNLFRVQSLYL